MKHRAVTQSTTAQLLLLYTSNSAVTERLRDVLCPSVERSLLLDIPHSQRLCSSAYGALQICL